jgi:inosine/xanthosine triphosphatase
MPSIVVASKNPIKTQAILRGFETVFPDPVFEILSVDVPSEVKEQPVGDDETRAGAENRVKNARLVVPQAEYWTAIEGGVEEQGNLMYAFAWIVIMDAKRTGLSRSASFLLPEKISALIRAGIELGHADDQIFGRTNSKQANGAVGILTNDAVVREELYTHAVKLALIPFLNPSLF